MKKSFVHSFILSAALLAVPLAYGNTTESKESTHGASSGPAQLDSYFIHELMEQAKTHARELRVDAEQMETFHLSPMTWESHAAKLSEIRGHVNSMGKVVGKLEHLRPAASAWQQQAIDRIVPVLKQLAFSVQNSIDHLAEVRGRDLRLSDNRYHLSISADLAVTLESMIRDYVDYGTARRQVRELNSKLELPVDNQG